MTTGRAARSRLPKSSRSESMGPIASHHYRVFVSFSHEDFKVVKVVAEYLESLGLHSRYTATLTPGARFRDQIKDDIARAHIFVPVLTPSAASRPWVHQEIGFALGMNVPLLPLAVGKLPGGMADELQALRVLPDMSDLAEKLTVNLIEYCVKSASCETTAVFEHAEYPEDRTRMLVKAAQRVLETDRPCFVRQAGRFGSFSLPLANPKGDVWKQCELPERPRSLALRRDLQYERRMLEKHARAAGCRLVLTPRLGNQTLPSAVSDLRITMTIGFLESMPDDKVEVVVTEGESHGNVLIIGDWFCAESITPNDGLGFLQTLGTWHAPTILRRIQEFDEEFNRMLRSNERARTSSRLAAIVKLKAMLSTGGRVAAGKQPKVRRRCSMLR